MEQGPVCGFVGFCALFSHEWLGVIATGAATIVALWLGIRSVQDGRRQSSAIATVLSSVIHADLEQCRSFCIALWDDLCSGRDPETDFQADPPVEVLYLEGRLEDDVQNHDGGQRLFGLAIRVELERCKQNIHLLHHLPKNLLNEVSEAISGVHIVRSSAYRLRCLSSEGGTDKQIRDELVKLRRSLHKLLRDLSAATESASKVAVDSRSRL